MKERATEDRARIPLSAEHRAILEAIAAGTIVCQKPYCRAKAVRLSLIGGAGAKALCGAHAENEALDRRVAQLRADRERR